MPLTYLGLPLGTTRPTLQEFSPMLTRIENRLYVVSKFLSYHGRLTLVNSVMTALPMFYMCTLQLPPQIIKKIDTYRKKCLWSGGEINRKGICLAAWDAACRSKNEGGLGIIDLKTQNTALLLKYLDKFYNQSDLPWVQLTWSNLYSNQQTPPQARCPTGSFWWKDILKLFKQFKSMSVCIPNKDNTVMFWLESWAGDILKVRFPQLFSFVKKPKSSLSHLFNTEMDRIFNLPLSIEAATQLAELQEQIQGLSLNLDGFGHQAI
jgi:hypothetical protein